MDIYYKNVYNYIYYHYHYLIENILYNFYNPISESIVSYHQRNNYRSLDELKEIRHILKYKNEDLYLNPMCIHININKFIKKKVYTRIFKLSVYLLDNPLCRELYNNLHNKLGIISHYIDLYLLKINLLKINLFED